MDYKRCAFTIKPDSKFGSKKPITNQLQKSPKSSRLHFQHHLKKLLPFLFFYSNLCVCLCWFPQGGYARSRTPLHYLHSIWTWWFPLRRNSFQPWRLLAHPRFQKTKIKEQIRRVRTRSRNRTPLASGGEHH